jgi:diguanylate cyclase (GGDEF)-like protein
VTAARNLSVSPPVRGVLTAVPRPRAVDDRQRAIDGLARHWAALAPPLMRTSPALHARLVTLLGRLGMRCRDEPNGRVRARRLGADVFHSGICGRSFEPRHRAEDVLAPTLALLREKAPAVLGLSRPERRRLFVVLDELAAGFTTALRDRIQREHEGLLQARLAEAAARDALTQLPNRPVTEQWVQRAFATAMDRSARVGLCALDLDGFAGVNDRLGRTVGDRLLVAVAARLRGAVAPHVLARTGGDEFLVLVDDAEDPDAVRAVGHRVREALLVPFRTGDRTVTLTAAVGVAVATPETDGPAGLMRAADVALTWAKAQGPGRVVIFDPDHDAEESGRAGLQAQLGGAPARGELRLHYQPLVRLTDGGLQGAEALVRWQHPELGLLMPGAFLGGAESSGAIVALDRWVLEQACAQAAAWWREHGSAAPFVSVNVSPVDLTEPGWAAGVVDVIDVTGVPPQLLQLEITEHAVLVDESASLAALQTLRDAGVRLALDDFGTGYSGLAWLRRLPVHAIKIDGSFVEGLRHTAPDSVDWSIIDAMVRMAHALDLEVTAEWVETAEQAEHLRALGCDLGQGHWFAHAGPAAWVHGIPPRTIEA